MTTNKENRVITFKELLKVVQGFAEQEIKKTSLKGWKFYILNAKEMDKIERVSEEGKRYPERLMAFCFKPKKIIGIRRSVIRHNLPDKTVRIIRHEIAHAIVGTEHGHDKQFRKVAKRIGGYTRSFVHRNILG